jgi:hypothetical protein
MLNTCLLACVVVLTITYVYGIAFIIWLKKHFEAKYEQLIEEDHLLRNDLRKAVHATLGINEKLEFLENSLNEVNLHRNKHELRNLSLSSYSHAAKLAQKGCSEEELVASLGLTKAEAQLVSLINKRQQVETN